MITTQQKQALRHLGFTHIAFDEDGEGYAYWSKPKILQASWTPLDDYEECLNLSSVNIFENNGKPWRESLEEL